MLDLCVAEVFKVLARKRFQETVFRNAATYRAARQRFIRDIQVEPHRLRRQQRSIRFHDVQTSRDIIIAVDRFFERMFARRLYVGIVDLLVLATGKYLIDFYGFSRDSLFIVTNDDRLFRLARLIPDIPRAYNPSRALDSATRIFY